MTADRITGLSLELSSHCQLRCQLCVRRAIAPDYPNQFLSPETLAALLPYLSEFESLDLTGWGEPLLHPRFSDFLAQIRRHFSGRLSFTTNGLLLRRELMEAAIQQRVDVICVSVDAASPETYGQVRQGGDFGKLVTLLDQFLRLREAAGTGRPSLFATYLLRRQRLEEVPAFVLWVRELGLQGVVFQQLTGVFSPQHLRQITYADFFPTDFDPAILQHFLNQVRRMARPGFLVLEPETIHRQRMGNCGVFDLQKPFVSAAGELSPCCVMAYPTDWMRKPGQVERTRVLSFGNVRDLPLPRLWLQPAYQAFRESLRAGAGPAACGDCISLYLTPAEGAP